MQKEFPLSKVKPNPFRNMELYPIDEAKVKTLTESYSRTGYWGNIVGRERDGLAQIAYGHHRLVTMQRTMKPGDKVEIIIKDISDADMLRMMADENMSEWSTNSRIEQETVRAVVLAYAAGTIELPAISKKTNVSCIRSAPSFRQMGDAIIDYNRIKKPYTAESIAIFLGWMYGDQPSPRVRNALAILEAAEETGAEKDFQNMTEGLTSEQGKELVRAFKDMKKAREKAGESPKTATKKALADAKDIADGVRNEEIPIKGPSGIRQQAKDRRPKKEAEPLPDLNEFVEDIAGLLDGFLRGDQLEEKIKSLKPHKDSIKASQRAKLVKATNGLIARLNKSIVQEFTEVTMNGVQA